jgi:conjugative transfer region protein (TIGR03750 family)
VFGGGSALRRLKRGRPDTWLYRQLQWRLTSRQPLLGRFVGGRQLVTRSGYWTTRRSRTP